MTLLRIEGSDPCDFALRFRLAAVLRGRETREPSPVRLNVRYEAGPLVGGLTMRLGAGQLPPCLLGRHPTELPSCKQRTGPVRHLLVRILALSDAQPSSIRSYSLFAQCVQYFAF